MSSKHFVVCVGVALLGALGCTGMMSREEHDREMTQANELADALRSENASLKSKADAYDQLNQEKSLLENASRTYAQMAESLRKALDGLGIPAPSCSAPTCFLIRAAMRSHPEARRP